MRDNSMITYLKNLKGNPKYCILTEPLWFIPYSLFAPYATIFMYNLGVTDIQIGFILSFGMVVQVFAAFFGGVFTDKFGRRMTTFIADLISWSLPCLIWAFAQNFWWFLIAVMFNSVWQVSNISWSSLLVEDSKPDELVYAYSWINVASVLSVFVSPIAFVLMNNFDPVFIVRCLYMFSFLSMTAKFLILFTRGHETKQGVKRMEETKDASILSLVIGYKDVFKKVIASPQMRLTMFLLLSYNICVSTVAGNFFGLYVTQRLNLDESFIAIFQMSGALVTLIFMFTIQSKLNKLPFRPIMLVGYTIFIVTNLLLVLAPTDNVLYIIFYTVLNSVAVACVSPRKDSLSATFIDKQERSRVNALMYMFMIGFTSPFGVFIGFLSTVDRRLPFMLNILIFFICFVTMFLSKEVKKLDSNRKI